LKLLADEHVDQQIVQWLRSQGQDVVWAAESLAGAPDTEIAEQAATEQRIFLTKDMDFGKLVFVQRRSVPGVLLLRLHGVPVCRHCQIVRDCWDQVAPRLAGHFVVISRSHIRIRELR
jgi:predicted nuclease of predicted toxin-antitoxin system